jgi:hypothetical protein
MNLDNYKIKYIKQKEKDILYKYIKNYIGTKYEKNIKYLIEYHTNCTKIPILCLKNRSFEQNLNTKYGIIFLATTNYYFSFNFLSYCNHISLNNFLNKKFDVFFIMKTKKIHKIDNCRYMNVYSHFECTKHLVYERIYEHFKNCYMFLKMKMKLSDLTNYTFMLFINVFFIKN